MAYVCHKNVAHDLVTTHETYNEISVSKNVPMRYTEAQLKDLFRRHDTNGDGVLSKQELRTAFNSLGALIPKWRANRAICHADGNGDGYISESELDNVVKYALHLRYTIK